MQRITKRNAHGGIELDGFSYALDKLAQYEDTGLEPHQVTEYQAFYKRITSQHSCGDCACSDNCDHLPEWGDTVRINCFAWEGDNDGNTQM